MKIKVFPIFLIVILIIIFLIFYKGLQNPNIYEPKIEIGKKVHQWNVDYLTSGPIVAMVLEGVHAIETIRKLAGHTVPNLSAPGTIRGDFSTTSAINSNMKQSAIQNLIHSSGDKEEAQREINLWFSDSELLEYQTLLEKHTR